MNEKKQLNQELQWVKYRIHILDIIQEKLLLMRNMADKARASNLSTIEIQELNYKINSLAIQVKALDEESKRIDSR
ncbi:hypothetical protein KM792_12315 [Clostridium tyrobutyricum]|uniref:hypothetical protein n=1 Tax=Clostridium tyrobutyricum TaxID=1519 RepID=UPI001C38C712|nr:hypothetical protein [Clostridium tyrobutyricum]MBV4450432.1 hypothetical protein [Clostridium tyrobutyricum]